MSECAGSPNSTNCLLPELLEELHKSEMVSHQRNISDMVRLLSFKYIRLTSDLERWVLGGKT